MFDILSTPELNLLILHICFDFVFVFDFLSSIDIRFIVRLLLCYVCVIPRRVTMLATSAGEAFRVPQPDA